jgi:hypothetical protein
VLDALRVPERCQVTVRGTPPPTDAGHGGRTLIG